jgi:hypothetical protein
VPLFLSPVAIAGAILLLVQGEMKKRPNRFGSELDRASHWNDLQRAEFLQGLLDHTSHGVAGAGRLTGHQQALVVSRRDRCVHRICHLSYLPARPAKSCSPDDSHLTHRVLRKKQAHGVEGVSEARCDFQPRSDEAVEAAAENEVTFAH